jgi:hypothetical protein
MAYQPPFVGPNYPPPEKRGTNGLAIASLVLGILWVGGLGSLLALIFGIVGKKQIRRSNGQQAGGGLATAGIVLGIVGIIGAILLTVTLVVAGNSIRTSLNAQSACTADYQTVATAVQTYDAQVGQYPANINDLLGTATASDGTTVGPWLTTPPVDPGHYQIAVSSDGSGTISVYTTGSNPIQIGSTSTVADCDAVS